MSSELNSQRAARDPVSYMLYCFDARGVRLPAEPVDAEDDSVAIAIVRLHRHKRCELWYGTRLVLDFPVPSAT